MTVWRISWDGSTITEARSPRLDERISAERLLRDLTFTLWPTQSIAAAVPSGFEFSSHRQGPTEIRELSSEGTALLRAHITQMGSRSMINRKAIRCRLNLCFKPSPASFTACRSAQIRFIILRNTSLSAFV